MISTLAFVTRTGEAAAQAWVVIDPMLEAIANQAQPTRTRQNSAGAESLRREDIVAVTAVFAARRVSASERTTPSRAA